MKYQPFCWFLFFLIGVNGCLSQNNVDVENIEQVRAITDICPNEPTATLVSSNVEPISLDEGAIAKSGTVSSNKHIGYTFNAQSGQQLQYQTEDDLCLWLYSPENKLVTSTELPTTGKYTLQISTPQGSQSFNLSLGFKAKEVVQTRENFSTSKAQSNPIFKFSRSDFPKSLCGDPKPSNPKDYPVNFYPVHVPYSERNLVIAKSNFCEDSFPKISKDTGEKVIQISSFANKQKARDFGLFISSEFSEIKIGSPTVIYE